MEWFVPLKDDGLDKDAIPPQTLEFIRSEAVLQPGRKRKIAEHLEEHLEECLSCLPFPGSHRRRIRTTNGLKRLNQEIKRRTRAVRIIPNMESCVHPVMALAIEQSEELGEHRRWEGLGVENEEEILTES